MLVQFINLVSTLATLAWLVMLTFSVLNLRQRLEALERAAERTQAPVVLIQGPEPSPTPEPDHIGGASRVRGIPGF
jgi:hypothetical protein